MIYGTKNELIINEEVAVVRIHGTKEGLLNGGNVLAIAKEGLLDVEECSSHGQGGTNGWGGMF